MRGKDMVAMGRIVLAKRERVIMLQPWDKGVLGTTLRYPYEVRDASLYFDELPDIAIPKEMLQLAEHILDSKAADFDPSSFQDRYEEAVVAMIQAKRAGMPQPAPRSVSPGSTNVVSLMDALKRSLAADQPKPSPATKAKKPRKRIDRGRWRNNRAENSHQPTRRREGKMQGFKSAGSAQRFLSAHAFYVQRHLTSARTHRAFRASATQTWREAAAAA
jgi:DNA end-binding protein Ku